ncbi:hypothetical protein P608_09660 [Comamonas thiooxydans]|uniref:Uncharacterized protein n=1 Tax=Comamonas thiooxydans TaxID=363952 RepID=A0A0E3BZ33_9BURK|nr:hypothetical protein P608_09660 [Comamonas thiooxydans]KGH23997.1 hypothetical protein P606_09875 [Comamonas thiooxydans]KGH25625.1 hypothetical protein P607_05250 [Comamonas thiooxydans]
MIFSVSFGLPLRPYRRDAFCIRGLADHERCTGIGNLMFDYRAFERCNDHI